MRFGFLSVFLCNVFWELESFCCVLRICRWTTVEIRASSTRADRSRQVLTALLGSGTSTASLSIRSSLDCVLCSYSAFKTACGFQSDFLMQLLLLQESPGNAPMNRLSVVFWRCRVSGLRTCTPTSVLRGLCTKPYTRQLSVGIQPSKNRFPCLNLYGLPPRRSCSQGFGPLWQNKTLQNYLQSLMAEHRELSQTLNLTLKEEERKALTQRHTELSSLSVLLHKIHEAESEARELEAMFADLNSREEEELLQEEQGSMIQNIIRLQEELLHFLVPHEKYDMNDAILEVVSGRTTGGDICQQFTGEVFDMYRNYAQYKSWSFEILNYTPNDYGGLHHAAARVIGEGVYKRLKYEGGIHRVQRIPEVGLSSRMQRIHTGTMTVIVLPQPDEVI
ncbi:peptide chain release factor 1, mitochondrial isoform X3 [Bufo bufo]|uniref:peptide chain release factor 1, mitochondrial isoform X3 n=1 Tax=Bufo bufo TaxID=8384 RepID=UPI001ABEC44A|nr:peptide chain release factor 1, mitochondrial isoform X3 [Bufo bufo]